MNEEFYSLILILAAGLISFLFGMLSLSSIFISESKEDEVQYTEQQENRSISTFSKARDIITDDQVNSIIKTSSDLRSIVNSALIQLTLICTLMTLPPLFVILFNLEKDRKYPIMCFFFILGFISAVIQAFLSAAVLPFSAARTVKDS